MIENYRPIILLCTVSKVLEKLIFTEINEIVSHLSKTPNMDLGDIGVRWSSY